jgi:hypothetical protein
MSGAMFHFDWGVFWAVLAALAIAWYFFRSGLDPQWHGKVLNKGLELQQLQIDMLKEQLDLQQQIVDKLPARERIDWTAP